MSNITALKLLTERTSASQIDGPIVGRLLSVDASGGLHIDYDGNRAGPLPARSIVGTDELRGSLTARESCDVLLVFERGRPELPIIVGALQPPTAALADVEPALADVEPALADVEPALADVEPALAEVEPALTQVEPESSLPPVEARLDGRRVVLEAFDELELRCGKASIVLRRNGRIVVRGAYVETRSSGVNRIRGGSVRIN
jgi:hypothetical protein